MKNKRNFLFCLVTEDDLSVSLINKLKKEMDICQIVALVGYKRYVTECKKEGYCVIEKDDCVFGKYEKYKEIVDMSKVVLDDDTIKKLEPSMITLITQQIRFEEITDYRVSKSIRCHYNKLIQTIIFWKGLLEKYNITDVVMNDVPHEGYLDVIYELSKIMNISIVMKRKSILPNRWILIDEYKKIFWPVKDEYERLKKDKILLDIDNLSSETKNHYIRMTSKRKCDMKKDYVRGNSVSSKFRRRYGVPGIITNYLVKYYFCVKNETDKTKKAIKIIFSFIIFPIFVLIKLNKFYDGIFIFKMWIKSKLLHYKYNCIATKIKDDEKFLYYAIQYMPEVTSEPLGGGLYFDQRLVIRILSQSIPDDWKLYVKIHPAQLAHCCDIHFFDFIKGFDNIRIISEEEDSYNLLSKAQIVSTLTGSVAWEAMFFDKPVLTFGYSEKNSLPLSYYVRTVNDCIKAIDDIKKDAKKINENELLLFCKALENVSFNLEEDGLFYALYNKLNNNNE